MWCSILQVYPCIKSTLHNYLGHWQHWPTSSQKNYEAIIPKTPMFLTLTLKCLNLLPLCINPIISYLYSRTTFSAHNSQTQHCNLQGHSSLTSRHLCSNKRNFDVLWARNSYPQLKFSSNVKWMALNFVFHYCVTINWIANLIYLFPPPM